MQHLQPSTELWRGWASAGKSLLDVGVSRCFFITAAILFFAVPRGSSAEVNPSVRLITVAGKVEVLRAQTSNWTVVTNGAEVRPGDSVRTAKFSSAVLRLPDQSLMTLRQLSEFQAGLPAGDSQSIIHQLKLGVFYIFHRGDPDRYRLKTPSAVAAIRGTELTIEVFEDGGVQLAVIEGIAKLENQHGRVDLSAGEQGQVRPGGEPETKSIVVKIPDLVEWCLHYPAVLHPRDLGWGEKVPSQYEGSIKAYLQGDFLTAATLLPPSSEPEALDSLLFRAAVQLGIGLAREAGKLLELAEIRMAAESNTHRRLVSAKDSLNKVIRVTKGDWKVDDGNPIYAPELLAESYRLQLVRKLSNALEAARLSCKADPASSFTWVRAAELELSFGNIREASRALTNVIKIAPRHPHALTLLGFIALGRNHKEEAQSWFDRALEVDPRFGDAWLGEGLSLLRQGRRAEAVESLEMAVITDPLRSQFRSYLAIARLNVTATTNALHELDVASALQPDDPTPWLYSALIHSQDYRSSSAIKSLEESITRNDNRALSRSRFLLDQDLVARRTGLARVYRDAGLEEAGLAEAVKASINDSHSGSTHQFLAEGYNSLRDPARFHLRHETVWYNEWLLASILSPVGAARLSQSISVQNDPWMGASRRFGILSTTEVRSDRRFHQELSQSGVLGGTAYALDFDYQKNRPVKLNDELERTEFYATAKQQLNDRDSLLIQTKTQTYHAGDNFRWLDPNDSRPNFRYEERQTPIVLGAIHRAWSPESHSILMLGRIENQQVFTDVDRVVPVHFVDSNGAFDGISSFSFDLDHRSRWNTHFAEVNQRIQRGRSHFNTGIRAQLGSFDTSSLLSKWDATNHGFASSNLNSRADAKLQRLTGYGYYTLLWGEQLATTVGTSLETVEFPENFRFPPIEEGQESRHRLNPKASFVWNPSSKWLFRATYARSLGGVSMDETYRLEPAQLAGFPQSFRTLISESQVGSVTAPDHEIMACGVDWKHRQGIYSGFEFQQLRSTVHQTMGVFDLDTLNWPIKVGSTREELAYRELRLATYLCWLFNDSWSTAVRYRCTDASLFTHYEEIPDYLEADQRERNRLHQLSFAVRIQQPCGWFATFESDGYTQHHPARQIVIKDSAFVHINLSTGWRFQRNRGEIRLSLLNALDQSSRLNSLTPFRDLPEARVIAATFRWSL